VKVEETLMSIPLDPAVQASILRLVRRRIECIRTGNRKGLNATYEASCIGSRNNNPYDSRWYRNLIEQGFGADIQRIDIQPIDNNSTLPFEGILTYTWPPEYKVFVQTVSGRRTLWLVRMFEYGPRVVLPAFGGQTADQVATGEWQLPRPAQELENSTNTLEFHPDDFVSEVAQGVATDLANWSTRLKYETLRAVALDCAPWFGQCYIALLTTKEDFPEEEYGKWAIGEWRWDEMESLGLELCELIRAYYEGKTITDRKRSPGHRAQVVFRCLAKALQSEKVRPSLKLYDLAKDFELGVFDPDDPNERNYCKSERRKTKGKRNRMGNNP
jgi:hypothetical protein